MKEGQEGHLLYRVCPQTYGELPCVRCPLGHHVRLDYVEGHHPAGRSRLPPDNQELLGRNRAHLPSWPCSDGEPFRPNVEYYLYFL